jgi:4-amino-4-deoxy-L-arabinose transferase
VALCNTIGELKYGLAYPHSMKQRVADKEHPCMGKKPPEVRSMVMRVKGDGELQEIERLPKDGKRYEQGNLVTLIVPQGGS